LVSTLRKEYRLRVFGNRVPREIFRPKREEVVGGWRRLCNEDLHNLYVSQSNIRVIKSRRKRWVGHVACMGEMRNVYKDLIGKPEEKRPLKILRHRWKDNIRMCLRPPIQWVPMVLSLGVK
jgi:hypothetical protein